MIHPEELKKDFPILTQTVHGKPLVYLDSAATSQKPQVVINAISDYYTRSNANIHRGVHELGNRSTQAWHESRQTIAHFFGALPQELVFVRNTTEALNIFALMLEDQKKLQGKYIITTQMEHHSNFLPWQELARKNGATFLVVPVTKDGQLDRTVLTSYLETYGSDIALVAITHVSNTLGTVNSIAEIGKQLQTIRKSKNTQTPLFVVDGAQAAPHVPIQFHSLPVDAYAVSAHKMLGPMGVGAIFIRKEVLERTKPLFVGGGMIGEVYEDSFTCSPDIEEVFTPGTPDVAGAVGWATACRYLDTLGMTAVEEHDRDLVSYAIEKLSQIKELQLIGPLDPVHRCGSVAFLHKSVHAHDVAQVLDSEGVAVRSGHHCTMPLHTVNGWAATTRMSFNVYTTRHDIDVCVNALSKLHSIFG